MSSVRSPSLVRLVAMGAAGLVAAGAVAPWGPWELAALAGWVVAAAVYLVFAWRVILGSDGEQTHRLATIEDDNRAISGLLVVAAATSALPGAALAMHAASSTDGIVSVALTAASVATVLVSWLVVNTDFTLRYAHVYHTPPVGGIRFPGVDQPDYHDFAYLAFTVGMTYQVSDTGLLSPRFRRILLAHAVVSFGFGTVIIATMINIVAGIVR